MKKTFKGIAATLLAAGAIFACFSMATKPIDNATASRMAADHLEVTRAENNTLASTPAEIGNLVKGLNIDIRNSAYLILQKVKCKECDAGDFLDNFGIAYFVNDFIMTPTNQDPAIYNLAVDDYNDCVATYGEDGDCYKIMYSGGPTWKTRVIDRLLSSERLQTALYQWILPELKRVVGSYDPTRKAIVSSAINHMIAYTSDYDHRAESAFYKACAANGDLDMFTSAYRIVDMEYDFDHVSNPYRRLETWVYRRVADNTMTASQINTWLKRLKADLGL